jgi:low affinity Fe/Cu permease
MHSLFRRFAHTTAVAVGTPRAFMLALSVVAVWALSGPAFGYSDSWQLVINTGTTIVTFLMVFLIQNTQNREARVTQLKLDELIRAVKEARNRLVAMEEMSDEELERIEREFHQLHMEAGHVRRHRRPRATPSDG